MFLFVSFLGPLPFVVATAAIGGDAKGDHLAGWLTEVWIGWMGDVWESGRWVGWVAIGITRRILALP